jgi:hypothetical protein
LAGAFVLPQNSRTLAGERGPANFDSRHRLAAEFIYNLPALNANRWVRVLLKGLQIAGKGSIYSGQPFTVNSIFDVNLDGNLTDRLNSTNGLVVTGNGARPLQLTVDPVSLLAPVGQDGAVGRNTIRAGNILNVDVSASRSWNFGTGKSLIFRADIFNLTNRANFGVPARFLEAPGFGQATSTVTPGRRVQFTLKYSL